MLAELRQEAHDYVIVKKRYSAFFQTGLDELLKKLGADMLIVGGVNTHACVRTAVIDAYQRDYEVVIATDCTDSYDEEHHRVSLRYLTGNIANSQTNEAIAAMLEGLKRA